MCGAIPPSPATAAALQTYLSTPKRNRLPRFTPNVTEQPLSPSWGIPSSYSPSDYLSSSASSSGSSSDYSSGGGDFGGGGASGDY